MLTRAPQNLIIKFWIPLIAFILIAGVGLIFFIRQAQLKILTEHELSEMHEIARGVALSTRLALKYSDPKAIDDALKEIAEEKNSYRLAVYRKMQTGNTIVLSSWPENMPVRTMLAAQGNFLVVSEPVNSELLPAGFVSVFLERKVLDEIQRLFLIEIISIVAVVQLILAALLFRFIYRIGKPIRQVTDFTELLLKGEYSGHLESTGRNYEIGRLNSALNSLKVTLSKEKSRNRELTSGLEFQISKKTRELKTVLERLNAAQRIAHIGNFVYWIDQDSWEMSAYMEEIMGAEILETENLSSFLSFIDSDAKPLFEEQFKNAINRGGRVEIDFKLRRTAGGTDKWLAMVGEILFSGEHNLNYLAGTIQDITLRKNIESQIEQLSLVAKLTNNGILITDENNLITWANESMTRISGYSIEEMIGRPPSIFQSEKTSSEVKAFIRSRLQARKNVRVEIENMSKDGNDYWIELHIEPVLDAYKNVKGFLAIQVDITQRKIQEQELKKTLEKQQELNQMRSRFLTMTSHEFRTPLTSIQATAEVIEILLNGDKMQDIQKFKRYLGRITGEINRLKTLMDNVISIERFEAGRIPFNPMETDLIQLISNTLEDRILLPNDPRQIKVEIQGVPRMVKIDPHHIAQAITNLATNALKYSPARPEPVLKLTWNPEDFSLEMCDKGIGIPQSEQPNLFQSFFRASNVENFQGTGIGLVIVRQLTEIHGGKVSLQSVVNVGTCIKLEFVDEHLAKLRSNIT
ncbi:MAG: PAS domain-containing sensor histidine kinase [Cyclobacteriaceae bacterium]